MFAGYRWWIGRVGFRFDTLPRPLPVELRSPIGMAVGLSHEVSPFPDALFEILFLVEHCVSSG
jgi:hypothetical protein